MTGIRDSSSGYFGTYFFSRLCQGRIQDFGRGPRTGGVSEGAVHPPQNKKLSVLHHAPLPASIGEGGSRPPSAVRAPCDRRTYEQKNRQTRHRHCVIFKRAAWANVPSTFAKPQHPAMRYTTLISPIDAVTRASTSTFTLFAYYAAPVGRGSKVCFCPSVGLSVRPSRT